MDKECGLPHSAMKKVPCNTKPSVARQLIQNSFMPFQCFLYAQFGIIAVKARFSEVFCITVSYRGVTATFNVTVKANAVAPGPEEQKPGNTNKPGATGNGNKNTVANTGSSVAAIAGAVALLAAAAGALFMLRKRA